MILSTCGGRYYILIGRCFHCRRKVGAGFNYAGSYTYVWLIQNQPNSYAVVTKKSLNEEIRVFSQKFSREFDVVQESLGIWKWINYHITKLTECSIFGPCRLPTITVLRGIRSTRARTFEEQNRWINTLDDRKWTTSILQEICRILDRIMRGEAFTGRRWDDSRFDPKWSESSVDILLQFIRLRFGCVPDWSHIF